MSKQPSFLFYIGVGILFTTASWCWSQEKPEEPKQSDPYEWVTESYSFPCFELLRGFTSRDRGELRHPSLPSPDASEEEVLSFVKKSNSITSHFLDIQGMSLPEGVVVLFDRESLTLSARAPQLIQGSIAFLAENYQAGADKYMVLEAGIIEASTGVAQKVLEEAIVLANHSALKTELENADGSRSVFFGKTECRSGNRTKIQETNELVYPVDFKLTGDKTITFSSDTEEWGRVIEFDPVLGADDITIDLNYAVHNDYAEPEFVHQPVCRHEGATVLVSALKRSYAKTTTQVTLHSGSTILLGAWPATAGADRDKMLVAYAECHAVKNLPVLNDRLRKLLDKHGDAVVKIPEGKLQFKQVAEEVPEGMIVRRYVIPPTFLSSGSAGGGSNVAADPFASAPIASEPRFTMRVTAKDILQNAGITFPEGSSANYIRQSSTLVIRNTPEQIELVEAYIESVKSGVEKSVSMMAYLVQAPGETLRRLAQDTRLLSDHQRQWSQLQQADEMSVLESIAITARSGNRARTEWGNEFIFPVSVDVDEAEKTKDKVEGGDGQVKIGDLSASVDTEFIGTVFEVDPVLGADNWTVDVNLALNYHHAAPVTDLLFEQAQPGEEIKMMAPITRFRESSITAQSIFRKGSIRMVSLWKPKGIEPADQDFMHALFLRVNVVELGEVGERPR